MKLKKFFKIICLIACLTIIFSGCRNDGDGDEAEYPTQYPCDFICGYMLTFDDPDDENYISPTSDDFRSDDAIARYVGREFYNNGNSSYLLVDGGLFINNSHNQISIINEPLSTDKSGSISMKEELFYTSELNFKQAKLYFICYNAAENRLYSEDYSSVTYLDSLVSLGLSDEMQAKILNEEGELETITYKFDLSIEFKEIDTLENIIITEYDNDDNKIGSVRESSASLKDFNNYQYEIAADKDCQYIIISKNYRKSNGEIYTERTIYNKDRFAQSEIIYVPYGNGLTMPMEIRLSFAE